MENGEWIEHDGKGMPVGGDTRVEVRFRDGFEGSITNAVYWDDGERQYSNWWDSSISPKVDITHYRIVS